jgi:hypothetical protein
MNSKQLLKIDMRLQFTLGMILLGCFNLFGQDEMKPQITRKIVMSYNDSMIVTQVYNQNKTLKTKDYCVYHWYSADKINTNRGGYSGKLLHGKYQVFNTEGRLITEGSFSFGLKTGPWKTWYQSGEIKSSGNYKDGLKYGTFRYYNPNGKIITQEDYKNDKLHGKKISFLQNPPVFKKYRNGNEVIKKPLKLRKIKEKKEEKAEKQKKKLFRKLLFKKTDQAKETDKTKETSDTKEPKKIKKTKEGEKEGLFRKIFRKKDNQQTEETKPVKKKETKTDEK